jgi:ADP-ribose pyrophosphatase YjhB (NUDIX family)
MIRTIGTEVKVKDKSDFGLPVADFDELIDKFEDQSSSDESYGVILLSYDTDSGEYYTLIHQRRHTYDYCSAVRGQTKISKGFMGCCYSKMTKKEKVLLVNPKLNFETIWADVWASKTRQTRLKETALKRFHISRTPKSYYSTKVTKSSKLPWGFPKGKKNGYDHTPLNCALREFEEETKIKLTRSNIVLGEPIKDVMLGTDSKMYTSYYFIAFSLNMPQPIKIANDSTFEKTVSCESRDVKWVCLRNCPKYISSSLTILFELAIGKFEEVHPKSTFKIRSSSRPAFSSTDSRSHLYGSTLHGDWFSRFDQTRVQKGSRLTRSLSDSSEDQQSSTPMPKSFYEFHPEFFSVRDPSSLTSIVEIPSEVKIVELSPPQAPLKADLASVTHLEVSEAP